MEPKIVKTLNNWGDEHRGKHWRPDEQSWHWSYYEWYTTNYRRNMPYREIGNRCDYGKIVARSMNAKHHIISKMKKVGLFVLLAVIVVVVLIGIFSNPWILAVWACLIVGLFLIDAGAKLVRRRGWDDWFFDAHPRPQWLHWLRPWVVTASVGLLITIVATINGNGFAAWVLIAFGAIASLVGVIVLGFYVAHYFSDLNTSRQYAKSEERRKLYQADIDAAKLWLLSELYDMLMADPDRMVADDKEGWIQRKLENYGKTVRESSIGSILDWFPLDMLNALARDHGTTAYELLNNAPNIDNIYPSTLANPFIRMAHGLPAVDATISTDETEQRATPIRTWLHKLGELMAIIWEVVVTATGTGKKLVCPLADIPGEKERVAGLQ